jgi:membrane protease YdiL (CAAX protease family)
LDNLKIKSVIIVLEGFGVLIAFHAIGGYYCAPKVVEVFPEIPLITVSMLFSSAMSPVIAIIYLALRTKFIPKFTIKKEIFTYILAGIVMAWIVVFISVLLSGKESSFAQEILKTPRPYYYLNLFLFILWGPLLEETLVRGYFFEILRQKLNDIIALVFSSILFVIPHGIWGIFSINLFFIFMYSVIFTLMYIQGGLIVSISVHAFVNFYLLYLNM